MGLNFYIACHACKKTICLSRGKESAALHGFYNKHYPHGQPEIQGDYCEKDWMRDYDEDEEIRSKYPGSAL